MLPALDANGNLPPGLFTVTPEELLGRFSRPYSQARDRRTTSLRSFLNEIQRYSRGAYIDGSYTTSKLAPADVDIALVLRSDFDPMSSDAAKVRSIARRHPDIHLFVFMEQSPPLQNMIDFWCRDRDGNPKGIVFVEMTIDQE
jgi:hypothetical protein